MGLGGQPTAETDRHNRPQQGQCRYQDEQIGGIHGVAEWASDVLAFEQFILVLLREDAGGRESGKDERWRVEGRQFVIDRAGQARFAE
jgi:hypothetical protein